MNDARKLLGYHVVIFSKFNDGSETRKDYKNLNGFVFAALGNDDGQKAQMHTMCTTDGPRTMYLLEALKVDNVTGPLLRNLEASRAARLPRELSQEEKEIAERLLKGKLE